MQKIRLSVLHVRVAAVIAIVTAFIGALIIRPTPGQLWLGLIVIAISMTIGLIWKVVLDQRQSVARITWDEYIYGGAVIAIVFAFAAVKIGWAVAWNSQVTYHEYWNGWELAAVQQVTQCTEDGGCQHTYDCDPYVVTYEDSKGHEHTQVEYHQCPYVTAEYTHIIQTTLGDYTIDNNVFASKPVAWSGGTAIPTYVQRGPSQLWVAAQARIAAGRPGPVTQRNDYENLLLASDTTILREYSDQISRFKQAGVLPSLQYGIQDVYYADKVYFVGYKPPDKADWEQPEAYLNAAFGTELQGDLHVVVVQNSLVSDNPDAYITALKAYWQDPSVWGKNAISKNSVIVVLGTTDGKTVSWARATTGMPVGNEAMTTAIQDHLPGVALTPQAVFGTVQGRFYTKAGQKAVESVGQTGALRQILWGMGNATTKFVRVSMTKSTPGNEGDGFQYLANDIGLSTGLQIWIVIICILLSCGVWAVDAFLIGMPSGTSRGDPYR